MKRLKQVIKYITIIVALFLFYEYAYKGYVNYKEYSGFINHGFSGLDELFRKNGKVEFYWKEYYKFDLMGKDQGYLIYKNNKSTFISVNENNKISTTQITTSNIDITSANSNIKFNTRIININPFTIPQYKTETKFPIFVVSDIEGNFDFLKNLLKNNNIVDNSLNWNFGAGHLVLLGDFFDRGNDVTAVLWLCYKLEKEAEKNGGKVHFLLGNHEQMNLQGNIKYVHPKYLALAQKLNIPYKELYGKDSELGRWLRSKNSLEIINNILFSHAGVSPNFIKSKETIVKTNENIRKTLDIPIKSLLDKNLLNNYKWTQKYLDDNSPLWYRGYFQDHRNELYKKTTQIEIDAICNYYGVNKIIVGHTLVEEIKSLYSGKVIPIDVERHEKIGKNKPSALFITNNIFFSVDELGRKFPIK